MVRNESPSILSIPKDLWGQIPSAPPPPGITSDFNNPSSVGGSCVAAASVFVAITSIFFCIRVYAKTLRPNSRSWDDLTLTLSFIGALCLFITHTISIVDGPLGIHQWNVSLKTLSDEVWIRSLYCIGIVTTPALGLAKLSLLLLYLQLFWPFRWLRIIAIVSGVIITAFYTAMTIVQIYYTTPRKGYTFFTFLSTEWSVELQSSYMTVAAVGLAVDIFLLVLPIRCVLVLQTRGRVKIGLILVFMTGILACICSLLTIYFRHKLSVTEDTIFWLPITNLIISMELDAGIAIACMPALVKVLRHHWARQSLSEERLVVNGPESYRSPQSQAKVEV